MEKNGLGKKIESRQRVRRKPKELRVLEPQERELQEGRDPERPGDLRTESSALATLRALVIVAKVTEE